MIEERLHRVQGRIEEACRRSGRRPQEIKLILVTKGVNAATIRRAYDLGIRDFGENYVQDLAAKQSQLPSDIKWHFIGHLQTNKVKQLLGVFGTDGCPPFVHSLDRTDLAKEFQKRAVKRDQTVDALIQINTSREETKRGFPPGEVEALVSELFALDRLRLQGLMTIGPLTAEDTPGKPAVSGAVPARGFMSWAGGGEAERSRPLTENQERIRGSFRMLRILRDRLSETYPSGQWHDLSMGMSSDFEIAIEEGANLLRIGTAVFGPRYQTL